jgi:hypothetical protein
MVAGAPVSAQSRLAVLAAESVQPATTWLFDLPSQRLAWTGRERLLNGVFTGTGRYFVAVKELSTAPCCCSCGLPK